MGHEVAQGRHTIVVQRRSPPPQRRNAEDAAHAPYIGCHAAGGSRFAPPDPYTRSVDDFAWLTRLRSRFIVFEGPDGSGKTTQFRRFVRLCEDTGTPACDVREPGGTAIGERIRELLLDHAHHDMCTVCEMLLYMASRAQVVGQVIRPALAAGKIVLADRFVSSTLAYQGAAGGIPLSDIFDVARIATSDLRPDLVVIFDVDAQTASRRLSPLLDRMEAKGAEFHRRVRQGYLEQARADPARHFVLDATRSPDEVWADLVACLRQFASRQLPGDAPR